MAEKKKPTRAPSRQARIKAAAKSGGLSLEKAGKGWRLVDAVTGTRVADDWSGDDGLSLDGIEKALNG